MPPSALRSSHFARPCRPLKLLRCPSLQQRCHAIVAWLALGVGHRGAAPSPAGGHTPSRQKQHHDEQADAVKRSVWRRDVAETDRGMISSRPSASAVSRKAPMMGPNKVPMPPMMGARISSIERDVEDLLRKQIVVIGRQTTTPPTMSWPPTAPPRTCGQRTGIDAQRPGGLGLSRIANQ